ncbi:putative SLACS reverse transcriptase [Trypanosoma cruzi]|uniref:Putative SLACS reverse transcriptase n=1 Tax=Trypanosoma cruzi TaxID=5693 RepID=A0A2V2UIG4_TRYCR|nr:putative SLACS reverse transcriptase [Trypanosoma cruzi]
MRVGKDYITHGGGRCHASLKTCFKNLQYGVGNSTELAIEKVWQDFHIKGGVAMLDGRNAYNAISRTAILSAVYGNTTWSPLWRVTRLFWARKGWWASTKRDNWSTRGSRRGECDKAWCWDRSFFHRHHRHPPPTGKQLPQRQLHGVPGRRYGGDTTGHAWAGMRGDIQSDACPGHRDERGQDGGPPYRRTSGHARGVHPAVCPRARCGNSNDPESELITQFVQRKAEETDRLFRAIAELPFAKHTQWRLLLVSALPRVTFLLRTHAPVTRE